MGDEYPRALYRVGDAFVWEGMSLDMRTVADADEQAEAVAQGWRTSPFPPHPLDHDGDGKKGGSRRRSTAA